jgi:heme-degrading monooxygenase HmoA
MATPVITIFRNRLRSEFVEEYGTMAARMSDLASHMPGFVDSKTFSSADGERVTVVTFADRKSHNAWRDHPEHQRAQQAGIERFYSEYSIQVGDVTYDHTFRCD